VIELWLPLFPHKLPSFPIFMMKITVMPTLFALFCADGDASHQPPDIGENRDV
jgi:hypothetical protein